MEKFKKENISIISLEKTTLLTYPAYKIISKMKNNGNNMKFLQIYLIIDSYLYRIQYNAIDKKYDEYLESMIKIIDSFEFIK